MQPGSSFAAMPATLIKLVAALVAALLVPALAGVDGQLAHGLSLFVLIGCLWLSEALHVSATAMLVPTACIALGIFDVREALAGFAHPVIYLFFGGFALAAALQAHRIDERVARAVIRAARGHLPTAVLGMFGITALLSMWISNTATTAMVLPLALGLIAGIDHQRHASLYAFVLLGVAWSANIGGIGTLVGSPPNAIVASNLGLSFQDWLVVGLPVMAALLPAALLVLWLVLRPEFPQGKVSDAVAEAPAALGRGGRLTMVIFALTVLAWVFSAPLGAWTGIEDSFDTVVALGAVAALLLSGAVGWKQVEARVNWGVLILFGGGITLSSAMGRTGTSDFLGGQLRDALTGSPEIVLILLITTFVVFLTELVSNTASAALLIPLFAGVASAMGMSELTIAFAIGISASCAFMLPVATPPNALAYGTGLLPQRTMMHAGIHMNLVCILLLTGLLYLLT